MCDKLIAASLLQAGKGKFLCDPFLSIHCDFFDIGVGALQDTANKKGPQYPAAAYIDWHLEISFRLAKAIVSLP